MMDTIGVLLFLLLLLAGRLVDEGACRNRHDALLPFLVQHKATVLHVLTLQCRLVNRYLGARLVLCVEIALWAFDLECILFLDLVDTIAREGVELKFVRAPYLCVVYLVLHTRVELRSKIPTLMAIVLGFRCCAHVLLASDFEFVHSESLRAHTHDLAVLLEARLYVLLLVSQQVAARCGPKALLPHLDQIHLARVIHWIVLCSWVVLLGLEGPPLFRVVWLFGADVGADLLVNWRHLVDDDAHLHLALGLLLFEAFGAVGLGKVDFVLDAVGERPLRLLRLFLVVLSFRAVVAGLVGVLNRILGLNPPPFWLAFLVAALRARGLPLLPHTLVQDHIGMETLRTLYFDRLCLVKHVDVVALLGNKIKPFNRIFGLLPCEELQAVPDGFDFNDGALGHHKGLLR
mmetsp:Transcript_41947/g.104713  ORF Transcript_41947/g.104713 Transcript_41947/m.104713 type:complete len:403 (+) Transcript_41947:449-1657(+)